MGSPSNFNYIAGRLREPSDDFGNRSVINGLEQCPTEKYPFGQQQPICNTNSVGDNTPDLNAIGAAGAIGRDPSEAYLRSLGMLDDVVRECIAISRTHAGISSPTSRQFYASVLFTMMVTKSVSLLVLALHTNWASKTIEHWDYASMIGIARTLIEVRVAFYYLCTKECSDEVVSRAVV